MTHDQIEELVRQGRKIFPVSYKQKKPEIEGWKDYALQEDNDALLADLLTRHLKSKGKMNFGMVAGARSGVLTIDIDFKHPEAEQFWEEWKDTLILGTVVSTGNGKHCHFKHPGGKVLSSIGGISKGIDLLCDAKDDGARYVLIPDSTHPSGAMYEYDTDNPFGTELNEDLPDMPDTIAELVNDRSKWTGHSSESQSTVDVVDPAQFYAENPHVLFSVDPFDEEPIPEGNRNNDMARIAGKILYMNEGNHNFLIEDLKDDMMKINDERCDPPLEEAEVDAMCNSIFKVKAKRDAKKAKQQATVTEIDFGPAAPEGQPAISSGAAFGSGVLPCPDEKPEAKSDTNRAALWILHQEPFKPSDESGTHRLIFLESAFYQRSHNVWRRVSEQSITAVIQGFYLEATKPQVGNMLNFMKNYLYFPVKNIPFWRGGLAPQGYPDDPRKLIPFSNGLFDMEHYIKTNDIQGSLKPHNDSLFNTVKMTYNLDATAKCPQWEAFLASIWGSAKSDRSEALREWSGHMMIPDVTQQKIAIMHGTSRSGKSTIGKMLHKLIGTENSVATSLHALMSDHGTVGLVGRTMAIMYDAHLPQKANGEKALEVLKSISGGDPQTINRKFHDEYTTLLTARVVMICNEIPRFNDTGDALLNRLLPFKFDISFNGREDHELETKLTHELEGIAIWALEGIKRYVTRGKLMTPREAVQDVQDLKRILNPVSAFAEDCMVMPTADPKEEVSVIELYQAYIDWADDNYMNHKLSKDRLLSKVRAIAPMIKQVKRNGVLYWKGMKLRDGANVSSQLF